MSKVPCEFPSCAVHHICERLCHRNTFGVPSVKKDSWEAVFGHLGTPHEVGNMWHKLSEDADRYRWLREQNWRDGAMCVVTNPKETVRLGTLCPTAEYLDQRIDEAMKGPK